MMIAGSFSTVSVCLLSIVSVGVFEHNEAAAQIPTPETFVVKLSAGQFKGKLIKATGSSYYAFRGIPYAEPPLASLRFEPPVQKSWWPGVKDTLDDEVRCLTNGGIAENSSEPRGNEDCLYLNVYTPSMRGYLMRAVMVFVGGNMFTTEPEYGPEHLVRNDVILVTLSYRSSVFGFLNNRDEYLSGNQGLKDIVMALKWVQTNARAFVGNPSKVTVFGHSSGAALVNYLLLSDVTKGLFVRAIMQSGCALMPHFFQTSPLKVVENLASALELNFTSTKELAEKLKTIEAEKLLKASTIEKDSAGPFLLRPLAFVPSVESKMSKEPFLTETPLSLFVNGKFRIMSIMIGATTNEAALLKDTLASLTSAYPPDFVVPLSFELAENSTQFSATLKELQDIYFGGRAQGSADEWLQIYTDQMIKFPVDRVVKFYASRSFLPVYYYEFAFDSASKNGTTHGDEIPYLFEAKLTPDAKAEIMRERMTALWTNFAKDGVPTLRVSALLSTVWLAYKAYSRYYYEINSVLNNRNDFGRMSTLSSMQTRLTGHF